MKRLKIFHAIIVLAITLTLSISTLYAAGANSPSSWAKSDVERAISLGLVPDSLQSRYTDSVTREEFCAVAVNVYETATGKIIQTLRAFDDTDNVNVQKMGGLEIVNGQGDNNFLPGDLLTREQAAKILLKLADSMGMQVQGTVVEFSDSGDISDWAVDAVYGVNELGVMKGTGNNCFEPKACYTIEQSIISSLRIYDSGVSLRLDEMVEIVEENVPLSRFSISSYAPSPELQQYAGEAVELINAERASVALSPLFANEILTAAANIRAVETEELFSHERPDEIGRASCRERV